MALCLDEGRRGGLGSRGRRRAGWLRGGAGELATVWRADGHADQIIWRNVPGLQWILHTRPAITSFCIAVWYSTLHAAADKPLPHLRIAWHSLI